MARLWLELLNLGHSLPLGLSLVPASGSPPVCDVLGRRRVPDYVLCLTGTLHTVGAQKGSVDSGGIVTGPGGVLTGSDYVSNRRAGPAPCCGRGMVGSLHYGLNSLDISAP